jgi:hypothetical protein
VLKSLATLSLDEALKVLVAASVTVTPNPFPTVVEAHRERAVASVLDELRAELGLSANDRSPGALGRLAGRLGSEISRWTLTEEGARGARRRLGEKGLLSLSQYKIVFSDAFEQSFPGVRKAHVEAVIRRPDAFDEIKERGAVIPTALTFCQERGDGANRFYWFVAASRAADTLSVQTALMAFANEVHVIDPQSPMSVLRGIAETYGLPVFDGPAGKRSFVEEEHVDSVDGSTLLASGDRRHWPPFVLGMLVGPSVDGGGYIAYAYAVDKSKYGAALRRHGVRTEG